MTQVTVNLTKEQDRVVGIIKSAYGLSSKNKAIQLIIGEAAEGVLERELRPEFVEHVLNLEKHGKFKKYSSFDRFWEEVERA
ncbi:hypothetical protein COX85_02270 [Candidatus Micrarchaeota archaeon CG_4_10_14_0_2_um_filter_55_9]|nr:MAG: hypothetical protein AUJ15_02855 [Candidatus Micrarchaeota archaeon CG1_02_55_41]PIO03196.1 MAG: hypothetical protein COT57_00890 [Candidatus Micrarchaeota archaeon CG09_land_8_20_14_0_10_55_25]PIZ91741.1 MAG: hypothetical protein COX85_02270 [Candidatus Micrarchaeota archaeon CG_4_10_14_0_2_um_filter_55_9]PJD01149.1 MAG: hypothetical protein COU38_02500 [Candidatus Micrarchaeota archaeon CG10_big_fil_rev_8_21_14_0_10_54_18]